jgi:Na+/H+ antiporter NhaD/arsenite permease-like protein
MTLAQVVSSLIFLIAFALILADHVHRTIVAVVAGAVMVAAGLLMGFYSQEQALRSIDFNTLGLLLGMMVLVQLLEQTGFFQYMAILIGKRSRGDPWRLLIVLGTASAVVSMFLNNVTTIVLVAPVTILIAEILDISPTPLLMAEAMLSNTGGVATLVGDPPNVLISSAAGFSFGDFLTHLAPIVAVASLAVFLVLRVAFRRELAAHPGNIDALMRLDQNEALHDPAGLRRLLVVLGAVILLFVVQDWVPLTPAYIALAGMGVALLWVRPDVDKTLRNVEWGILLFFAGLFVAVGGLESSGLMEMLAFKMADLARGNLLAAGLLLLWAAAVASAVVDNIPFTIALIPVILHLGSMGVQTSPLWWALALGAGLGGNGTIIGSMVNVVTVALSEKTQAPITSQLWIRIGMPVTLVTCVVAGVLYVFFFGWMRTP